jgi:hypothetical protein
MYKKYFSKGSEDIRANEGREDYRTPYTIYDEPSTAAGRITVPGYRYLPVSRDTYGYSPRNIYSRPSSRPRELPKIFCNIKKIKIIICFQRASQKLQ